MIDSAVKRSAASLLLGLALLVQPAAAQSPGAPIRLTPRPAQPAIPPLQAPGAPAGEAAQPAPGTNPQAPAGFQVDTLQSVDSDTVGVLEANEHPLPVSMWNGTPRPAAERLLTIMPAQPASRTLYDLERRLLLSSALSPEGPTGEARLIVLRTEKLIAMGELAGAAALMQAVPQRDQDERLARLRVDAAWLAGDLAGACGEARQNLAKSRAEVWQRAQAFCLALDGDKEKADLAMRLLPEQGFADDPVFNALMEAVLGNERSKLPAMPQPRPIDLAMLGAAHRPFPSELAASRDLKTLAVIAGGGKAASSNAERPLKLAAAERLEAAGAWKTADLKKLYAAVELPPEALANPPAGTDSHGRAVLWQATRKQEPQARLALIGRALASAADPAAFAQAARLYGADLEQIQPTVEALSQAPLFGRALEAAGRPEVAQRWIGLLESEAPRQPEAKRQLEGLWALSVLAQPSAVPWSPERFQAWRQSLKGPEAEQDQRLGLALVLIDAAGHQVPSEVWRDHVTQSARRPTALPPPTALPALAAAEEARRLAETVALAEITLGETALADQPALILGALVKHLRAIDLGEEARALALESAIAAGL